MLIVPNVYRDSRDHTSRTPWYIGADANLDQVDKEQLEGATRGSI